MSRSGEEKAKLKQNVQVFQSYQKKYPGTVGVKMKHRKGKAELNIRSDQGLSRKQRVRF